MDVSTCESCCSLGGSKPAACLQTQAQGNQKGKIEEWSPTGGIVLLLESDIFAIGSKVCLFV